mmetsp:Transcript_31078/g.85088  ORF Transcript_31078/g.85088 Transcript_31078/m.85088 type:complete len:655 (-) Transcript_31078:53-2017(-)
MFTYPSRGATGMEAWCNPSTRPALVPGSRAQATLAPPGSAEKRGSDPQRIRKKYPSRVPVVCTKAKSNDDDVIDDSSTHKLLTPGNMTGAQFLDVVRKRVTSMEVGCLMVAGKLVPDDVSLSELDDLHRAEDGFLYAEYGTHPPAVANSSGSDVSPKLGLEPNANDEDTQKSEEGTDALHFEDAEEGETNVKVDASPPDKSLAAAFTFHLPDRDPKERDIVEPHKRDSRCSRTHKGDAERLLAKFPDRVPVLCRQAPSPTLPGVDKKLLPPRSMHCDEFKNFIRNHVSGPPKDVAWDRIRLCAGGVQLEKTTTLAEAHDLYKAPDGLLLVTFRYEERDSAIPCTTEPETAAAPDESETWYGAPDAHHLLAHPHREHDGAVPGTTHLETAALVEEVEQARKDAKKIVALEAAAAVSEATIRDLSERLEAASKRIAGLEADTVTLGDSLANAHVAQYKATESVSVLEVALKESEANAAVLIKKLASTEEALEAAQRRAAADAARIEAADARAENAENGRMGAECLAMSAAEKIADAKARVSMAEEKAEAQAGFAAAATKAAEAAEKKASQSEEVLQAREVELAAVTKQVAALERTKTTLEQEARAFQLKLQAKGAKHDAEAQVASGPMADLPEGFLYLEESMGVHVAAVEDDFVQV